MDFLAEVATIDGRIGLANFSRVLTRCEDTRKIPPGCLIGDNE